MSLKRIRWNSMIIFTFFQICAGQDDQQINYSRPNFQFVASWINLRISRAFITIFSHSKVAWKRLGLLFLHWGWGWRVNLFNPVQCRVSFHVGISHLICNANQMTGFYMECNNEVNWVKANFYIQKPVN